MTQSQLETYRAALQEARESFKKITQRLNQIGFEEMTLKRELVRLRRTITALAAMCSEELDFAGQGITELCGEVMRDSQVALTTNEVVTSLEEIGFDLASQKNPAASVHAILSRLAERGAIQKITGEDNVVSWRGPNYDPEAF